MNQKHCIACEKPEIKENMCCYSIYMKFKAGKINYGNKNQNSGCLSVSGGGEVGERGKELQKKRGIQWPEGTFSVKEISSILFGMEEMDL